jgi:hypothetical protein
MRAFVCIGIFREEKEEEVVDFHNGLSKALTNPTTRALITGMYARHNLKFDFRLGPMPD